MVFFYSRKLQIVMLSLWCAGMAAMYTTVTGGGPDFFTAGKNGAHVENAAASIGTIPEPSRPAPPPVPVTPAPPPLPHPEDNYVIREGDTVIKIAARRGLDPRSIIERNRLSDPDLLRPGDTLILPAPGDARASDKVRHAPHGRPDHAGHGQNAHGARHETPP
ncbi:MAG: LysM peptidoglycan-binding domain-containing protein [Desulfovibrio sp.]|jgi:LysM repeat protein|nr:LysM peptidoglycan-binding domain-containing protein [Desulfovibrio sp.]